MAPDLTGVLPFDIWDYIFSNLSICDLTKISLVSHRWQASALPHLYHIVYLARTSHLEHLAEKLTAGNLACSIDNYLRGLVIDEGPRPHEPELDSVGQHPELLKTVLNALPQLEYFSWELPPLWEAGSIIKTLQANHPKLRSFRYVMKEDGDEDDYARGVYLQLFEFTGLFRLSLDAEYMPDELEQALHKPLASFIRACPDLEVLDLVCNVSCGSESGWRPQVLWSDLTNLTLQSLHTFRAVGTAVNLDWNRFFEKPADSALRSFLVRHPGLRTVGLVGMKELEYKRPIDATYIEGLFSSLTNFEGQLFICTHVVASRLADQIESLTITDSYLNNDDTRLDLTKIAQSARCMPRLRRLVLNLEDEDSSAMDGLDKLLHRAPELQELVLRIEFVKLDNVIEILHSASNIHKLSILPVDFGLMTLSTGENGWRECVSVMARICPKLRYVHELGPVWDETSYWMIVRGTDGEVSVISDGNR